MNKLVLLLFTVGLIHSVVAQTNTSNVYLFEMKKVNEREYKFENPQYLTAFNPSGYNNQPTFFSSSELAITVQLPGEDQTEIYLLDLYAKTRTKVTETIESEYSPTQMPDLFNFSSVRVETDGRQRLWQFPIDRLNNGKPIFKYINNVGYHHWVNSRRVLLFLVDDPNELVLADIATDETTKLMSNVGRCLQTLSNGNLAFVHKITPNTWQLKQMNVYDRGNKTETIVNTLPGSEDFLVLNDGTFLMGSGSKLFKYNPLVDKEEGWREIADFKFYNIQSITRLALSRDNRIAIVSENKGIGGF